jgi:Uma2 family endonuclease
MLEVPPHLLEECRRPGVDDEIGLFASVDDYRLPDLGVYRPDQASARGIERTAELVIELVSPGDESRAKLQWYAARGVREMALVDRDTLAVELFATTT